MSTVYRPFTELNVGFSNAENYQRRENKELLTKYFVRDAYLERLLDLNIFFLVGEKGTGKTAYATFLENSQYKNHKVSIFNVRQTEYQKFLELKKAGQLPLSEYAEVWRTLLLIASATSILDLSGTPEFLKRFTKLGHLKNALEQFYEEGFSPEIISMLNFVESAEVASKLGVESLPAASSVKAKLKSERTETKAVFQTNLLKIRRVFEQALSGVKLNDDALIFIDGIDVRPADIPYADYFECVQGLIEAIWSINNDFLANIKDFPGRIRVVLLVRPDIFLRTGLHNLNTKLRDNSVFLNWITTYKDYRGSMLFRVADKLLSVQQPQPPEKVGVAWDHYFPFHAENVKAFSVSGAEGVNSFLSFLRFSYYRPRDINSMVAIIQEIIRRKRDFANYVEEDDFGDPSFRDALAEYLLGEIRDQLLFYYSQDEYALFLQFFSHLRGRQHFTYEQFVMAFNEFVVECANAGKILPQFFESSDVFLQFLYEQNVICYKERDASEKQRPEAFIRWCFRERTLANLAPKIRIGVEYEIFYGLTKALNIGRVVKVGKTRVGRQIGTVISLELEKGFGFIRGGERQADFYFKISEYQNRKGLPPQVSQKVSFEIYVKYGKPRARNVRPSR